MSEQEPKFYSSPSAATYTEALPIYGVFRDKEPKPASTPASGAVEYDEDLLTAGVFRDEKPKLNSAPSSRVDNYEGLPITGVFRDEESDAKPTPEIVPIERSVSVEDLRQVVTDISNDLVEMVRTGNENRIESYLRSALEQNGPDSREKRFMIFEFLANNQRYENYQKALEFGEDMFADLDTANAKSCFKIPGLGNELKSSVADINKFHGENINSQLRSNYNLPSFLRSYQDLAYPLDKVQQGYNKYSDEVKKWQSAQKNQVEKYKREINGLSRENEDRDSALKSANESIVKGTEGQSRNLSELIDDEVINTTVEKLVDIIKKSMDKGESPNFAAIQELCKANTDSSEEIVQMITDGINQYSNELVQKFAEFTRSSRNNEQLLNNFSKNMLNIGDYVRDPKDGMDAIIQHGKQQLLLDNYRIFTDNLVRGTADALHEISLLLHKNAQKFHQNIDPNRRSLLK